MLFTVQNERVADWHFLYFLVQACYFSLFALVYQVWRRDEIGTPFARRYGRDCHALLAHNLMHPSTAGPAHEDAGEYQQLPKSFISSSWILYQARGA